jgi:hypothetical protein
MDFAHMSQATQLCQLSLCLLTLSQQKYENYCYVQCRLSGEIALFIFVDCELSEYVSPEEGDRIQSPKPYFLNKKTTMIDSVQTRIIVFNLQMFYVIQRIKY